MRAPDDYAHTLLIWGVFCQVGMSGQHPRYEGMLPVFLSGTVLLTSVSQLSTRVSLICAGWLPQDDVSAGTERESRIERDPDWGYS